MKSSQGLKHQISYPGEHGPHPTISQTCLGSAQKQVRDGDTRLG